MTTPSERSPPDPQDQTLALAGESKVPHRENLCNGPDDCLCWCTPCCDHLMPEDPENFDVEAPL